jgi:hypothetical protein
MARNSDIREGLIEGCLQTLKKLNCCSVEFIAPRDADSLDGILRLTRSGEQLEYTIEVKQQLTQTRAAIILHRFRGSWNRPILIFTEYVHGGLSEYLKENQMEFVDTAGNAYLNRSSLLIYVVGQKCTMAIEKPTRAFQASGLKIIFLFLKQPDAVNWNYREIAEATGTALGGISWVVSDLRRLGFVRLKADLQRGRQNELNNWKDLIERWELGYVENLRPKLFRNRYRIAAGKTVEELVDRVRKTNYAKDILIGGELGAALLLDTLRPQSATLYLLGEPLKLITALKLIPDPSGNVAALDGFGSLSRWGKKEIKGCTLADPLLIHAELLLQESDRLREVANDIYNRIIVKRFQKPNDYHS